MCHWRFLNETRMNDNQNDQCSAYVDAVCKCYTYSTYQIWYNEHSISSVVR